MNVYLFFGFEEATYNHELARFLQSHESVDKIAALVPRAEYSEMLSEQTDVNYHTIHCIPQIHSRLSTQQRFTRDLRTLETEYGDPSLWPYLLADRRYIKRNHHEQQQLIQGWFNFFLDFFDDFEPDLYLSYAIAASRTWIPYILTAHQGGMAISWKTTRVESRYELMINDAKDHFPRTFKRFRSFRRGDESVNHYPEAHRKAKSFLASFREEQDVRPDYFIDSVNSDRGFNRTSIKYAFTAPYKLGKYIYHNRIKNNYFTEDGIYKPSITDLAVDKGITTYRKAYVSYIDVFDNPEEDEQFILFPLHLQPEASTMLLAPMYLDQPALVRQIARSLPLNYKLYVKEHPRMVGNRPISYYKRFSDLSNVRLIAPWVDSHKLIQDSELVTTITGTAGLEALFYQTPVLTFGNTHYNEMEMVLQGDVPDQISNQIFKAINEQKHDEQELIQYLTALFEESFEMPEGACVSTTKNATANARAIYEEIKPFLDYMPRMSLNLE